MISFIEIRSFIFKIYFSITILNFSQLKIKQFLRSTNTQIFVFNLTFYDVTLNNGLSLFEIAECLSYLSENIFLFQFKQVSFNKDDISNIFKWINYNGNAYLKTFNFEINDFNNLFGEISKTFINLINKNNVFRHYFHTKY